MRVERFATLVVDVLRSLDHPDIASVEFYEAPGHPSPAGVNVTMRDGHLVWLRTTSTSRDGGDDHRQPEHIPFPEWEIPPDLRERLHGNDQEPAAVSGRR